MEKENMPRRPRIPVLKQALKRRINVIRERARQRLQRLIALRATRRAAAQRAAAKPRALRTLQPLLRRIPARGAYAPAGRLVPEKAAMPRATKWTAKRRVLGKAVVAGTVLQRARVRALAAMPAKALKPFIAKAKPGIEAVKPPGGSQPSVAVPAKRIRRRAIARIARAARAVFGTAWPPGKRAAIPRRFLLPGAAVRPGRAAPFETRVTGAMLPEKAKAAAQPEAKVIAPSAQSPQKAQPRPAPPRQAEIPKKQVVAAGAPEKRQQPKIPEKYVLTIRAPKRVAHYESRPPEKRRWWQGAASAGGIDTAANRKVLVGLGISEGSEAYRKLVNANSKELAEHAERIQGLAGLGLDMRSFADVEDAMLLGSKELEEIAKNAGENTDYVLRYSLPACVKAGLIKDVEGLRALEGIMRTAGEHAGSILVGVPTCVKAGLIKDVESLRVVGKELAKIAEIAAVSCKSPADKKPGETPRRVLERGVPACVEAGIVKDVEGLRILGEIVKNTKTEAEDVLRYGVSACAEAGIIKDVEGLRILGEIVKNLEETRWAVGYLTAGYALMHSVPACAEAGLIRDNESLRAVGKELVGIAKGPDIYSSNAEETLRYGVPACAKAGIIKDLESLRAVGKELVDIERVGMRASVAVGKGVPACIDAGIIKDVESLRVVGKELADIAERAKNVWSVMEQGLPACIDAGIIKDVESLRAFGGELAGFMKYIGFSFAERDFKNTIKACAEAGIIKDAESLGAVGKELFDIAEGAGEKPWGLVSGVVSACAKAGVIRDAESLRVLGEIARNAGGNAGHVLGYGVVECAKAGIVKDAESLRAVGNEIVEIARNAGGNARYVLGYGVVECAKAGIVKDAESLRMVGKEFVGIAQRLPAGIDIASSLQSIPPFKSLNDLHAFAEDTAKFDGNIGSMKNPDAKKFIVAGLAGFYAEDNNFRWDAGKFAEIYNKYENFKFHPGLITKGNGFGLKAGGEAHWEFKKDTSGKERLFSSPSFGKLSNLNKPWDINGLYDVMLAGSMRPELGREEWVGRNSALDAGAQEKLLVDALKMLKPEQRKEVFPKCFAFALWREGIAYPKMPANVNDAASGREFLESEYELLKHANEFWAGRDIEFGEPKYTRIISDEMRKVRKGLRMEKIAIEVDGSIGLLNAFDGARGQTCIANYGELVNDARYKPLAFNEVGEVGGKQYKINHGVAYAVEEKVDGERALVIFGIEPKKELLARCSTSEFVGKAVEEIKRAAKANGIGRVYISLESGETSNKKDVIDVVVKLVRGRTKIATNFPMETPMRERDIGEL